MFEFLNLLTQNPILGLIILACIAFAIGFHEAAHAYSAYYLGDNTPKLQGRLTLNPIKHLDPIGSILIVLVGFGWGKPVQFNPNNLKNPRKDAGIIAIAGPLSNIFLAIIGFIVLGIVDPARNSDLFFGFMYFININLVLAVFNMIPIEPLDGFKVVAAILPRKYASQWYETARYGLIILIIFMVTGFVGKIITPAVSFLYSIIALLFGFI